MLADIVSMVIVLKMYVICAWLHFYRFIIPERTDKPTHTKHKQSIMAPLYNSNNRTMLPYTDIYTQSTMLISLLIYRGSLINPLQANVAANAQ